MSFDQVCVERLVDTTSPANPVMTDSVHGDNGTTASVQTQPETGAFKTMK